ncbi:acrosomal protein KIAA1210 homolog [Phacochoerus africanus]|uniref:acrosomal protein KIAA1210 homolog n=1 Tax=Phacochoerus africanus TaxID=41426 RepID=UPI001FDA9139|nr:acrosomal protein KIAA1210 homolog [Phacochoerus africanus]
MVLWALEAGAKTCRASGKKKFKFKAFKSFFGKKKKKEPEDAQGERELKLSLSSGNINISSLKPVLESQHIKPRAKSSMGNKSLSHDSIFMVEPELQRSASKICPFLEIQRGRSLQRSHVFRTLPRAGTGSMHGAVFGAGPQYASRSGVWVAGSKITEIPPLRPRQPSISPPLIRSDTISKDLEEISVDDESPKSPQKKVSSHKILTLKKSSFEPSSGPVRSQSLTTFAVLPSPSSTQVPTVFSAPATTQGCLDSSAARHKMALNPRKQKQKKNFQATAKPEQEEPSLLLVSEKEKSPTKSKEADQKKPKKDNAGPSSQEQSNKTEVYEQKTTDQTAHTDAAGSQGSPLPAAHRRRHGGKGSSTSATSECGSKGRSFKQSSRALGLGDGTGSPPADKTSQDCPFWNLPLEKQDMEQPTPPQTESTTPQEPLAGKDDLGRRNAGTDFEARKASASEPTHEDMEEFPASGPSPCHEDRASGAKKAEAIAALLPVVESPSTTQDVIYSVAVEDQMFMDSSHSQSEEEEDASSFDLKSVQFKMKSAQDTYKEKPPRNVLQAFPASTAATAGALAEGGVSAERLPPRSLSQSLGKPKAEAVPSDSESTSEAGSGSEQHLTPGYSFQPPKKVKNEQDVFPESKSSAGELSGPKQQRVPRYASRSLGKPRAKAVWSDSESALEVGGGAEQQQPPTHPFQPLRKSKGGQGVVAGSSLVVQRSSSDEQLSPRCASQALREPEDEASTGSNSYVERYSSARDWNSSEEDLPPTHPSQALGRPKDQKDVSSVSKTGPDVWGVSVEQMPPRNPFQTWVRPQFEQQARAGPESTAEEWGISIAPLPPRVTSKRLTKPKVESPISSGPEITTSMELPPPRHPSQPRKKPLGEQEISAGPEGTAAEGGISAEPLLPRYHSQPLMRPLAQQQVSSGPESAVAEGSLSREPLPSQVLVQPLTCPIAEQNVCSRLEGVAAEKAILLETLLPKYSPQSLTDPQVQELFPEDTAMEESMFAQLLPPRCPSQLSVRPKFWPQTVPLDSVSTAAEWSSPGEPMSPRYTFQQPWVSPTFEQQASARPESAANEWGNSMEPVSPWVTSQPLARPIVKQPISAGPEGVAIEGGASPELLPPKPSRSTVKHRVHQMSSFESAAVEVGISGKPPPPKYPAQVVKKANVQEMSSHLESTAAEEGIAQKLVLPGQSFVKFMAQQVFSESPATEEGICVDLLSTNQPSKSVLRPKAEHQVFSGWESSSIEGDLSLKQVPTPSPVESLERPEGLQEVFSHSGSAPVTWSSSKEPLPPRHLAQALGKPQYQQDIASVSEEWKSSKEQLPGRCPVPAKDESQPQTFSAGPRSAPMELGGSEEHLPPRHPFQALADLEHKQQVYSSSTSAATEGTVFERSYSCWSLPRAPASPNKSKKHSQSSEDLIKTVPTPATKPVKFAVAPAWQTPTTGATYSNEEVLESGEQSTSHSNSSTNGAEVENLFGVRLRKTCSSQESEKQDFAKLPSPSSGPVSSSTGREQHIKKRASQGLLGTAQNLPAVSSSAERPQRRPKSESMAKKQPAYRTPGKAPGRQSDFATSEPSWMTTVKQRQGSSQANLPAKEPKTKSRDGAKAETKEPRHGRAGLANENKPRRTLTSDVNRQEKMARMKPLKTIKTGFEDEKIVHVPSVEEETRKCSTLPAVLQQPVEPAEPVWFSLAKKKAKAWSHIAESMQ